MCLSASSLSISHYHPVEPVKHVLHDGPRDLLVGLRLPNLFVQNVVKVESSWLVVLAQEGDSLVCLEIDVKAVDR